MRSLRFSSLRLRVLLRSCSRFNLLKAGLHQTAYEGRRDHPP